MAAARIRAWRRLFERGEWVSMAAAVSFVKRERRQWRRGRGKSRNYVKLKTTFYLTLISDKVLSFVAVYIN